MGGKRLVACYDSPICTFCCCSIYTSKTLGCEECYDMRILRYMVGKTHMASARMVIIISSLNDACVGVARSVKGSIKGVDKVQLDRVKVDVMSFI
jgi:hypothetical protein